jgi:multidrug resistance efflux pump
MNNSLDKIPVNNIYKLPEIKSKYSSRLVSKVVSFTFVIIASMFIITLIIATTVKINVTIDATGQLEPTNLVYVHSPLEGEIKKIYVKGGTSFLKDDLLVQFDSVKLNDQLEKLKNDLAMKKIDYEIKAESIPFEINQSEQQKKQAEAQLLKAKANLRDKMQSFFPGVNIDSFMNKYKKGTHIALDYALSDVISSEASIEGIQPKETVTRLKDYELKSLYLQIKQLEKNIERQYEYLSKTKLTAPFDGIVLTEDIKKLEGSYINEGASLFEISKTGSWKAYLSVGEKDAYELNVGDSVKIEVKAMRQADDYLLIPGKVTAVSAEQLQDKLGQTSSGLYRVDVAINNKDAEKYLNKFKRGFNIDAKIIKDSDKIINVAIKNIRKLI